MIPFYNFEIPSNGYNMMCSSLPILNLANSMMQPQFYPTQQMICLGYLPQIENIEIRNNSLNSSHSTIQSGFFQEFNGLEKNKPTLEILRQIRTKQINQHFQEPVPKSKVIKKYPKVKYLKKNTQSNVSNQVLTFLTDEKKSKDFVIRLCHKFGLDQKQVASKYYECMEVIKSSTKKYISKKILLRLSIPSSDHTLLKQFSKINFNLSQSELNTFCKITRILMRIFLTEFSHLTVLTSKKIHREGTVQHLTRRRQIKNYLQEKHLRI